MKKILLILFLILATATYTFAQESPEQLAQKHGISFPIIELGGCENYALCRTFCEDPVNAVTCEAFARAKGFYQEDALNKRQEQILAVAKAELGCSDKTSCEATCHLRENFDKCSSFASRNGLAGGHVQDPAKQEIITKAKEVLGCDSETTCRAICQQESNRDKCDNFAKQVGLRGGETHHGPGGCTSESTCKTFCSDPNHFQECSQFGGQQGQTTFSGPGGCNTQESCRIYCEKNPSQCHSMEEQSRKRDEMEQCFGSGKFWYNATCNNEPSSEFYQKVNDPRIEKCFREGQVWEGGICHDRSTVERQYEQRKAQEYADYCRQYPDKCKPGETGTFTNPEERTGFESFCTKYPERCKTVEVDQTGQKRECESDRAKQYGCRWTGDRCDCPGYSSSGTPGASGGSFNNQPRCGGGSYWNGSVCVYPTGSAGGAVGTGGRAGGSTSCPSGQYWNGSVCATAPQPQYQQQSQKTQEQMCGEAPNCHWENGTCNCSSSNSGSGTSLSPDQQCAQSGRCWRDGSCQDCSSGSGGGSSSSGSGGGECESHGGHWENGSCVGAVQGVATEESTTQKITRFISRLLGLSY